MYHLRAILGEHSLQHPSDPLVPVRIMPGDEHHPADYVIVSVDPAITQEPRQICLRICDSSSRPFTDCRPTGKLAED